MSQCPRSLITSRRGDWPARRFTVLLPCYNEREGLVVTVERLRRSLGDPRTYELLVIDDGSSDDTPEILGDLARRDPLLGVLRHQHNRGYGAALKTGLLHSTSDLIVITDADGTYPSDSIPDLVWLSRRADMVVGSRQGSAVFLTPRWLPKLVLRSYVSFLVGRRIPDMNSGLRVFSRSLARNLLDLLPDGFSFTTTITMASMLRGESVVFVDIPYRRRLGRSKFRPVRDTFHTVRTILRTGFRLAPIRLGSSLLPPVLLTISVLFTQAPFSGTAHAVSMLTILLLADLLYLLGLGLLVPREKKAELGVPSPRGFREPADPHTSPEMVERPARPADRRDPSLSIPTENAEGAGVPARPLRISTFAAPLSGNKGSASMLLGLIDAFATAGIEADFAVFSYYSELDQRHAESASQLAVYPGHPVDIVFRLLPAILMSGLSSRLVPGSMRAAVERLRDSDAVLLIGGTTFADSMLYKVPWNCLAALPGYFLRKPTIFLSQTLGPMRKLGNRVLARPILSRALAIHGRGRKSEYWARQIGAGDIRYWPDLSFSMIAEEFDVLAGRNAALATLRRCIRSPVGRVIGLTPNTIVQSEARRCGLNYTSFLTRMIEAIEVLGHLPVLIPHGYRSDTRSAHNNDRRLCRDIMRGLSSGTSCQWVDEDLDPRELRCLIGRCDLLVASRFHSMISALASGVPPLTFGWGAHKYLEVLEEFGVEELYTPFTLLEDFEFEERLQAVLARRGVLAATILSKLDEVRAHSARIPHEILGALARQGRETATDTRTRRSM